MPRHPDSIRTSFEEDRTGRVHWQRVGYVATTPPQYVRNFYRTRFQDRGWRIVRNEVQPDGIMLVIAERGAEEATVRIEKVGRATVITVVVSEIRSGSRAADLDPASTLVRDGTARSAGPVTTPPRLTQRPMPARDEPERRRTRNRIDRDDDAGGDPDDDDGDDDSRDASRSDE